MQRIAPAVRFTSVTLSEMSSLSTDAGGIQRIPALPCRGSPSGRRTPAARAAARPRLLGEDLRELLLAFIRNQLAGRVFAHDALENEERYKSISATRWSGKRSLPIFPSRAARKCIRSGLPRPPSVLSRQVRSESRVFSELTDMRGDTKLRVCCSKPFSHSSR